MGPVGGFEHGELFGGEGERLFEGALFGDEDLGWRHDVVGEEEVGEVAELAEGFDAGLDERRRCAGGSCRRRWLRAAL